MVGSIIASLLIPRARRILATHPLEHVQVTPFGSVLTRDYIPGAAKRPAPAQNVQVPTEGGIGASPLIPRASALMQVLEHTQMPSISCSGASERIPQPLGLLVVCEDAQVPAARSFFKQKLGLGLATLHEYQGRLDPGGGNGIHVLHHVGLQS